MLSKTSLTLPKLCLYNQDTCMAACCAAQEASAPHRKYFDKKDNNATYVCNSVT